RIRDVGAWATAPCECGRGLPLLRRVTGRATDFLIGHDGRMVAGPFLAHSLVAKRPSLGQLQVVQTRIGELHFRIKPGKLFREAEDGEFLRETARKYLGETTLADWELVNELTSESSGKFLFCKSTVSPGFLRTAPSATITAGEETDR